MKVIKTIKLYIDGAFVRTESGRSYTFENSDGKQYARLCQASRKDFRNAVASSKKAQPVWAGKTAYNRSQILYRIAEMMESKSMELVQMFMDCLDMTQETAETEVSEGIDTLVYYAGFCDKYQQVMGAVNPVNMPYHNFTTPDPVGVVTLLPCKTFKFSELMDNMASILVGGNSVIILLGDECPTLLAPLAEILATSDVPGGVVNLLTGHVDELLDTISTHLEVRSISVQNEDPKIFHHIRSQAFENMKRVVPPESEFRSLKPIMNFLEFKTVWHPIGQ